jgi:hypothetical protein
MAVGDKQSSAVSALCWGIAPLRRDTLVMRDLDETVRMIADLPLRKSLLCLIAKQRQRSMRRVALAVATAPSARSALERCDNVTELTEFYSSCNIVRQPLGRKRMTIFAIFLQNDCKREENGDACIASLAEKIITISIYKPLRVKTRPVPKIELEKSAS